MDDLADRLTVFADRDSPRGAGAIWHAARRSARRQRVARRSIAALTVAVLAFVAVTVAALTIYDMCKSVDRSMTIDAVRLEEKLGGRSGHFQRGERGA